MLDIKPAFNKDFEDRPILKVLDNIFIKKRGFAFKMPLPGESVILLVSGGIDSTSLWNLLIRKYKLHVYPVYIFRRKLFDRQRQSINFFSLLFKKKYPDLFHKPIVIPDRTIVSLGKTLKTKSAKEDLSLIIPNLVVSKNGSDYTILTINSPGRLTRFSFDAYEYAHILKYQQGVNINTIFCGIIEDDSAIIRESTLTVLRSINLSFCLILGNFDWQFTGALESNKVFSYDKAELIRLAIKNGLPLEKTWSCDKMGVLQCGTCPSCIQRKEAFTLSKIKDNTPYLPKWFSNIINVDEIISYLLKFTFDKKSVKEHAQKTNLKTNDLHRVSLLISQEILWGKIEGLIYIFNKKTGFIVTLNKTGSCIFEEIAKNKDRTIKQLTNFLTKRYKISKTRAEKDTVAFVKTAVRKGYLVVA